MALWVLQFLLNVMLISSASDMHTIVADAPDCVEVSVSSKLFVPIFMLTRDRMTTTQKAIRSYHQYIHSPWELVIMDHNSTYPPMVQYLKQLESKKTKVVHVIFQNSSFDGLMAVIAGHITDYLKAHSKVQYYVMTDPDIVLNYVATDILIFYAGLLASCSSLTVVGPAMRLTDLPDHYAMKKDVLDWEKQYWSTVPHSATWKRQLFHFAFHPIDTTFAMRRASTRFARGQVHTAVRTYAPYMVKHYDWYRNMSDPGPDYEWYRSHRYGWSNYA